MNRFIHRKFRYTLVTIIAIAMTFCFMNYMKVEAYSDKFQGEGTIESPYLIETSKDLVTLSNVVSTMEKDEFTYYSNRYYQLTSDIDMTGVEEFQPIGNNFDNSFGGTFGGLGHKIIGLTVDITNTDNNELNVGLFGYNKGTITNLDMINSKIQGNNLGAVYVGGIAGTNTGVITNSYNTGTIIAKNMDGLTYAFAGGIAGASYGGNKSGITLEGVYNTGTIQAYGNSSNGNVNAGGIVGGLYTGDETNTISDVYNTGEVFSTFNAGGIAGSAYRSFVLGKNNIEKSYNTGYISGSSAGGILGNLYDSSSVQESFNRGTVLGNISVGGIVGESYKGTIKNTYNEGLVTGEKYIGGIIGIANRSIVNNNYNIGTLKAQKNASKNYLGGILGYNIYSSQILENHYLNNVLLGDGSDSKNKYANTFEEMLEKATYNNFSFDAIWIGRVNNAPGLHFSNVPINSLNLTSMTLEVGESFTIAKSIPSNSTTLLGKWSSSDDKVASVDHYGIVTTHGGGTATISYESMDGSYSNSESIYVVQPVTGVTLETSTNSLDIGDSITLVAKILPEDASNQNIVYESSNNEIATVSETGIVLGKTYGEVTMRAVSKDGGYEASVVLIVEKKADSNISKDMDSIDKNKEVFVRTPKVSVTPISYLSNYIKIGEVKDASGYQIYRSTSKNSGYKRVATIKTLGYKDTNLSTGTTYYYRVKAYTKVDGKAYYSTYSTIHKATPYLGVPSNLTVKKSSATSSKITWSKVSGATGYRIYRYDSVTKAYTVVTTTKSTTFKNTGLKKGRTYYYKVRAYRKVDNKKIFGSYTIRSVIKY